MHQKKQDRRSFGGRIVVIMGLGLTCSGLVGPISFAEGEAEAGAGLFAKSPIDAYVHATVAAGNATEQPEDLAVGGHDPTNEFTVQGIETGFSLRLGEYLSGFTAWTFSYGAEEQWNDELEEAFVKLSQLPGGLELRGGRMLNRFGERNAQHLHAWETIDQHLVNARFLGDDGLITEGGDVTWLMPLPLTTALTLSYGTTPPHEHGHGHAEGEEDESEEIGFADAVASANLLVKVNRDDFNQFTFSASAAQGENGFEGDTTVFGLGANYTWRENGLERGGRQWRWSTEVMLRDFDLGAGHAHDEDEAEHDAEEEEEHEEEHDEEHEDISGDQEFGFYSSLVYMPQEQFGVGLRVEAVQGMDVPGVDRRSRLSPHVTWYPSAAHNLHVRLQANFDRLSGGDDAQAVWLQVGYSFGGSEVR